jgi:hypothetical protein
MRKTELADEIVITINPLAETIGVEEKKDGVIRAKRVAPSDLVKCFEKSIKDAKRADSGFLPENCLSVSVTAKIKTFFVWHPLLRTDYTYHKTVYERFPIPRTVFGFDVANDGRVTKCKVAVVADEKPGPDTKIYEWPFSNVYGDGSVCVGAANNLPAYKNTRALSSLPHLILSLPNNDHNYSRAKNRLRADCRELLEHMKDKEPSHWYELALIPREGKTLRDFIDGNMEDKA